VKIICYLFIIGISIAASPIASYSSDWECLFTVPSDFRTVNPRTGEEKTYHPGNAGVCMVKIDYDSVEYLEDGNALVCVSLSSSDSGDEVPESIDLYEIDCANQRCRCLQAGYDELDGSVPFDESSPWYCMPTGGALDLIFNAVCSR